MIVTAWRIVPSHRVAGAFSGEGARINGGRWNNKGASIVYTSSSVSLASMEIIVHLPAVALLKKYVTIPARFDDKIIEALIGLPEGWDSRPPSPVTENIGDRWVSENRSAVLKVPSVVVPAEHNYLLNPAHPDWKLIEIEKPQSYAFDPRLAKK